MSAAIISPCGQYRYTLHRRIPSVLRWVKPCLFVMLNPSTADATMDDPTIRRCLGFAKREGCTGLTVVNLFALRATDPSELAKHPDPIGADNAKHIAEEIDVHQRIGLVIAAWGAHPMACARSLYATRSALLSAGALCLGTTKDGSPRHPLYVKADQPLVHWTGQRT
jgi:hypothetical protein